MEENNNVVYTTTTEKEGSKFGWGVLGFFFPIVGLVLFLVWMKDKKKASTASGIGALIGFILQIILVVLSFMGVISIFSFIGGPVIDNKGNTNNIKIIDDEEDEEETVVEPEVDLSDPCNVKATKGSKEYSYNFSYDETCEAVKVLDDNNKVLFKINNGKIVTNSGKELEDFAKSFLKINNSVILYSNVCEPSCYGYVYVYNTKDSTGFVIDSSIAKDDMLSPKISEIETDGESILKITVGNNDSAGLDSLANDPRVKVFSEVRNCQVTDIDKLLSDNNIEAFPMEKTYTYKSTNVNIANNPTIEVTKTIKDYYNDSCSR